MGCFCNHVEEGGESITSFRLSREDKGCHLQDHSKLSTFFGLLKLLLSLTELGKIKSGNLLSLFDLLFVGLDLSLKFGGQLRHAVLVLSILSLSKGKLLGLAFSSLEGPH